LGRYYSYSQREQRREKKASIEEKNGCPILIRGKPDKPNSEKKEESVSWGENGKKVDIRRDEPRAQTGRTQRGAEKTPGNVA